MGCTIKCDNICCGKGHAHPDVVKQLNCKFRVLRLSGSASLLNKHLTPELFKILKWKKTNYGMTLLDCAQTGFENPDSSVGLYAACPESYDVFGDLFDEVIMEYHGDFKKSFIHPPMDWGDSSELQNIDPDGKYVISTRVRTARSLKGYPFNPGLTEDQYLEIEDKVVDALTRLEGDLKGQYVGLINMTPDEIEKMINEHILYKEGDRFLNAARAYRFWPEGRGYFYNPDKTFIVWVNEEDHMRIISLQEGGNLGEVYQRLANAVTDLSYCLDFEKHERFGYLSMCPTNIGTGIRASVHIKLPRISEDMERLKEVAKVLNLQIRGTGGEHTESQGGVLDISNKRRLGITEIEVIREMNNGIQQLIAMEKSGGITM